MRIECIVAIFIFWSPILIAQSIQQELVSSSGASFQETSYQLDWSIGEPITETHTSPDHLLSQGFHQSVFEVTALNDALDDDRITLYPNPTTGIIELHWKNESSPSTQEIQLSLFTMKGERLWIKTVHGPDYTLDLSTYSNGYYLLSLHRKGTLIRSFKIMKMEKQ